jgi:hypothetical protein
MTGRIDLVPYLLLAVTVMLMSVTMVVDLFAFCGLIHVTDGLFDFVPSGAGPQPR